MIIVLQKNKFPQVLVDNKDKFVTISPLSIDASKASGSK